MKSRSGRELPIGWPLGLAIFAVYLPTVFGGYLSDDFVFLARAREGWFAVLDVLTGGAGPRFIRPLPSLYWMLAVEDRSGVVSHLISIGLHVANTLLVRSLLARRTIGERVAWAGAALFAVAPWISEAVAWPSGIFDLSATFFCLSGLVLWDSSRDSASFVAFGAALLCKESVVLVPLILPLLGHRRRIAWWWGGASLAYLAARWLAFDGLGGYPLTLSDLVTVVSALPVTLLSASDPLRLAASPAPFVLSLAAIGGYLAILVYVAWPVMRRPGAAATAGLAALVVAAPILPILYLSPDHAGGRLLYLPIALGIVLLAASSTTAPEKIVLLRRPALLAVLTVWSLGTMTHALDWMRAGREVRATLAALDEIPDHPGVEIALVDASEVIDGAYVFRNGLDEAVDLRNDRKKLSYLRGTAGRLGPGGGSRLGEDVVSIGVEDADARNLTRWEKVNWRRDGRRLELHRTSRVRLRIALPPDRGRRNRRYLFVRLHGLRCAHEGPGYGALYWRDVARERFFDSERRRELSVPARVPIVATWFRVGPSGRRDRRSIELRLELPSACSGQISIEEVHPPPAGSPPPAP